MDIHLLEIEGLDFDPKKEHSDYDSEAFCRVALSCLDSLNEPIDCCLSFDNAVLFPRCVKENPLGLANTPQVLVIDTLEGDQASLTEGLKAANRTIIAGRDLKEAVSKTTLGSLENQLKTGTAFTLSKPLGSADSGAPEDKVSAKAGFQTSSTLEVCNNVPLVLFPIAEEAPFDAVLKRFLEERVQVVCIGQNDALNSLAKQYPDRLCLASSSEPLENLLLPVDGCVVGRDPQLTAMALANGAVPIAGPGASGELTDLEPSLASGSGIIIQELTETALVEGLSRFQAAFLKGPAFLALTKRLPNFVPSWSKIARHYIQLIEELQPNEN